MIPAIKHSTVYWNGHRLFDNVAGVVGINETGKPALLVIGSENVRCPNAPAFEPGDTGIVTWVIGDSSHTIKGARIVSLSYNQGTLSIVGREYHACDLW